MPAKINIVGRRFTRLFVFAEAPAKITRFGKRVMQSWVRCDCGKEFIVVNGSLMRGATKSCGCLNRELSRQRGLIHGNCSRTHKTAAYSSWLHMIQRCTNPNCDCYHNYGGRGICICSRWRTSFPEFLSDMGPCPDGMEIDRWPDNKTGHYSCGKCQDCLDHGWPFNARWATRAQNNRNHRRNKIYTVNGVTACKTDLAAYFGLDARTVTWRLRAGWSVERAFTTASRATRLASTT